MLGWKGLIRIIMSDSCLKSHTIGLRVLYKCFLNPVRLYCDHFSGEPVPVPKTLWVKKVFLVSNLVLP